MWGGGHALRSETKQTLPQHPQPRDLMQRGSQHPTCENSPGPGCLLPTSLVGSELFTEGALRFKGRRQGSKSQVRSSRHLAPLHPQVSGQTPGSMLKNPPHPLLQRLPMHVTLRPPLTRQWSRASPQSHADPSTPHQAPRPLLAGAGLYVSRTPTDLVGKEQVAHGVVVWVLHDGADHLQHRSDACKRQPAG